MGYGEVFVTREETEGEWAEFDYIAELEAWVDGESDAKAEAGHKNDAEMWAKSPLNHGVSPKGKQG